MGTPLSARHADKNHRLRAVGGYWAPDTTPTGPAEGSNNSNPLGHTQRNSRRGPQEAEEDRAGCLPLNIMQRPPPLLFDLDHQDGPRCRS